MQTTIKAEIVDAAAQEDHVGLTPMDIAMEVACSNGRKKLKTNEYAAVEKTASDNEELRAYADVRYVPLLLYSALHLYQMESIHASGYSNQTSSTQFIFETAIHISC